MGAVAALLAGACVAPVIIQVVLFASNLYSTGTTVALALPFFLGIGMATVGTILRVSGLDDSQVRPVPADEDTTGPRRLSQARRSLVTQG